jgi:death-on-curing protein
VHTASLYGACARAFQTFDGEELYPTPFLKAAALFHGIICDHVFIDGNKRTATFTAVAFLVAQQVVPARAPHNLAVRMLGELAVATADAQSGSVSVEQIANWFRRILDESLTGQID